MGIVMFYIKFKFFSFVLSLIIIGFKKEKLKYFRFINKKMEGRKKGRMVMNKYEKLKI